MCVGGYLCEMVSTFVRKHEYVVFMGGREYYLYSVCVSMSMIYCACKYLC